MKTQVVVLDLKTDGAFPVPVDMYIDADIGSLKLNIEKLHVELGLRLTDLSSVLSDDLHG